MNCTVMEYEAIWKLKPSDLQFILCIPRKYTKTRLFCCIKCEYQLVLLHHFLKSKVKTIITSSIWCDWYDAQHCYQKRKHFSVHQVYQKVTSNIQNSSQAISLISISYDKISCACWGLVPELWKIWKKL